MQKPTNPTSAFLNLKSSIDTTQSSEKCCSLPLSWLSGPFTFWNVPFLFPFHLALTVPGSANKNEPSTEAILLFSGCTLLIPYPPISPVICMMNFSISNTFFSINNLFFLSWVHEDQCVQCFLWGLDLLTSEKVIRRHPTLIDEWEYE